jgi:hypothetical protein
MAKTPRVIDVGTGDDQYGQLAPGVYAPNQPPPYDPATDKQVAFDAGTAGGSASGYSNSPVYRARQAAMGQLFPGIGVSRFLNTLGANETDTQDRFGSSPLFSSLMLQSAQPRPEVQVGNNAPIDVAPQPYDPMTDLNDFRRSRKTGGASPYKRQAIQSLFGA